MTRRFDRVECSYYRCCISDGFFDDFYRALLARSADARRKFRNTDFKRQNTLLRSALRSLVGYSHGDRKGRAEIDRLARRHAPDGYDVRPGLYDPWVDALVATVERHDPYADEALCAAWRRAVEPGIRRMCAGYRLYGHGSDDHPPRQRSAPR